MSFHSFFRNLSNRFWRRKTSPIVKRRPSWYSPVLESLEKRELLATTPVILSVGVLPVSGSTTASATPIIQVQYNESMVATSPTAIGSATNPDAYLLLGSTGNVVPITAVTSLNPTASLQGEPLNSIFSITYDTGNAGNQLIVDSYTLFVKGSKVTADAANNFLPMANPGQLIVANGGNAKNVSIANLSGNGTVGAESQYSLPSTGAAPTIVQPQPWTIATGDLNNDGVNDLAVVDAGTNQVSIFAGQGAANGGGYELNPSIVLNLPAGAANMAEYITFSDFDKNGHLDIAVASANSSNISVFMNTASAAGSMSFSNANSFLTDYNFTTATAVANNPVGIASSDFDGDGNPDIAVALSNALFDTNQATITNATYDIQITSASWVGGVATFNTAGPTALAALRNVTVSGFTGSWAGFNFTNQPVDTIISPTRFTILMGSNPNQSGPLTGTPIVTPLGAGPTTVVLTTTLNHGFSTGQTVTVSALSGGFASYNGNVLLTRATGTSLYYDLAAIPAGNGPTGGGFVNDNVLDYNVNIFQGNGDGTFAPTPVQIRVGDVGDPAASPNPIDPRNLRPSALALGYINSTTQPDLILGGDNQSNPATGRSGLSVLRNTSTFISGVSTFSFSQQTISRSAGPTSSATGSGAAVSSIAVGKIDAGTTNDIVALTTTGNIEAYLNRNGNYPLFTTITGVAAATSSQIAVGDLNGDGLSDIVLTNGAVAGKVAVYLNGNFTSFISAIQPATSTTPTIVTSAGNGLTAGQQITITGASGASNTNGTWTVAPLNGAVFTSASGGVAAAGGIVGDGITDISVTTASAHNLTTGTMVTIANSTAYPAANGSFRITVTGANTFTLDNSSSLAAGSDTTGNATWSVAGIFGDGVKDISVTTAAAHNLTTGTQVTIAGSTLFPLANGTYTITVRGTNTFTLDGTAGITGSGTSGLATWTSLDMLSLSSTGSLSANATGSADVTITVPSTAGLFAGDTIRFTNITSGAGSLVTALNNNSFTITNVTATTFDLVGTSGFAAGATSGGNWTFLSHGTTAASWGAGNNYILFTVPSGSTAGLSGSVTIPAGTFSGALASTLNGQTFTVSSVTATSFRLNTTTNGGATINDNTGGGWRQVTNIVSAGNTKLALAGSATATHATGQLVTITTGSTAGLVSGQSVTMSGFSTTAGTLGAALNGNNYTITVTSATTFTLALTTGLPTLGSPASGGTWTVNPTFFAASPANYSVDSMPFGVVLTDSDKDGHLDIITANNAGNNVSTLLGNGNGTFQLPVNTNISNAPGGVKMADLNGDGILDMVILNNNGNTSSKITILQGQQGGTYAAPIDFNVSIRNLVGLDIGIVKNKASGLPDIVYVSQNDNAFGILVNGGTVGAAITSATFSSPVPTVSTSNNSSPTGIALADFDGDGNLDVVVSRQGSGGFGGSNKGSRVFLGNGDGTFPSAKQTSYENSGGWGGSRISMSNVVTGDFNNDGKKDFITLESTNSTNKIYIHYGDGLGGFASTITTTVGITNAKYLIATDFNNDGFLDLAISSSDTSLTSGGVSILLNQFGSGFGGAIQTQVSPGTSLGSIIATDINQDGFKDVIVAALSVGANGSINSITTGGGSDVRISTPSTNGLSNGMLVTITGLTGTAAVALNGNTYQVNSVTGSSFKLTGTTAIAGTGTGGTWGEPHVNDNVFVLIGNGDGTLKTPTPYQMGSLVTTDLPPSYLAATPSPLIPVTTFSTNGNLVQGELVANGTFEARDLNGYPGTLQGWQTYNLAASNSGSFGAWTSQTGTTSPFSGTAVPSPSGSYRAILDENNQTPYTSNTNPNTADTYHGSHALYQDIYIPAGALSVTLSMSLYADNSDAAANLNNGTGGWSNPTQTSPPYSLDYRTAQANQQVRVDILDPSVQLGSVIDPILGPTTDVPFGKATASVSGNVVTISTPNANASTLANGSGQSVVITGMTGAYSALNGNTYFIANVNPGATDTTFTLTGTPSLPNGNSTGTWTLINTAGDGVLRTEFITGLSTAKTFAITITDADLTAYAGQTIRLRIAATNNQGRLIIGVDNVSLKAKFADSVLPTLTKVTVQSPAFYSLSGNASASVLSANAPVTITTTNTSGLTNGSVVQINGLSGALASLLNGNTYSISNVTGTTFTLDQSNGPAAGLTAAGGTWSYLPHTNDSTILGTVGDTSGLGGIAYVAIDPTGTSFTSSSVVKISTSQLDSTGNFSVKLPSVKSGYNLIGVAVVDKAGNTRIQRFEFFMQTNSVTEWQALGPQGIDVSGQGVDYTLVSGRITSVVPDQSDPSGSSYFVGTPNGGIWKTTNNGASWLPTTNLVTDGVSSTPVPVTVGGMAQAKLSGYITSINGSGTSDVVVTTTAHDGLATGDRVTLQGVTGIIGQGNGVFGAAINGTFTITMVNATTFTLNNTASATYLGTDNTGKGQWSDNDKFVLYAGMGVGDRELDSKAGAGVLRSIDGGNTWTLIGNSGSVMQNVRTVKVVIDKNDTNVAYVGDAGDQVLGRLSGAVYKTTDGGLTWTNVLTPAALGLAPGTQLASVTDLVIDPFDSSTLLVGLGNIGLVATSATAGVYKSALNGGATWSLVPGGDSGPGTAIPTGVNVGRVAIGWATGQAANEKIIYVSFSAPPGNNNAPSVDFGQFTGLYKTSNFLLDFTKVMLREDTNPPGPGNWPSFTDIGIFGRNGANTNQLIVDPNNPNVVYVGGSRLWRNPADPPQRQFLYVDTGNMANNGDDKDKAQKGANRVYYDVVNSLYPYTGEGVYWYDLDSAQSGNRGKLDLLPDSITALAFDSQGRLIVGTIGGIWRGTNLGMSYDFTSGGSGIMTYGGGGGGGANNFSTPGYSFVSLNGNLQIADMTSVALDPNNAGVFFGTQYDTGVSGSVTPLAWTSQGLTGPTVGGNNLNIPTAWNVSASNPPPGSPAGTPVTLFRLWQYADNQALIPEISVDGGTTWTATASAGISSALTGGIFPAFAVNPTPILNVGLWQTQLLFGTNTVYISNTSGAVWNQVGPPMLTTGTISAMAFAPSTSGTFYVGTDIGELFVTTNSGGTFTPTQANGLPAGKPINGITVDPNNSNIAFAMLGSAFGGTHLYKTVNGGASWTAVAGPWGNVQTYQMVIDRLPNLGASGGKFYLATEIGVYYSADDGATWQVLGSGMPRVPVVGLSYSSTLQTLAAATLGRGVLTINTAAISVIANQTIDQDVNTTTSPVIPFTVNDIGLAPGSYTLTATSNNQALIPSSGLLLTGTGANRTIQIIPALHANSILYGSATITLSILYQGRTFQQTFTVTVNAINYAPTINNSTLTTGVIANQTTAQDTQFVVNFNVNDVEDGPNSLVVTATSNNQILVPDVNITPGPNGASNRILTIKPASGSGNVSATNGAGGGTTVTISTANTSGLVNGQTVRFDGLTGGTGTLANALNYSTNGNQTFLISNVGVNSFTVTTANIAADTATNAGTGWTIVNNFGTAAITVTVKDSKGVSTTTTFNVLVTTNAVLPASDTFTRSDSPFLGPQWSTTLGSYSTSSGAGLAGGSLNIATLNGVSAKDAFIQADVKLATSTASQIYGLVARYGGVGDTNMYLGAIYAPNGTAGSMNAVIFRNVNGVWTQLTSKSLGAATTTAQTLRFEVFNDSLKLFVGGTLKAWANDSAISGTGTAKMGFRATTGAIFDNLSADNLASLTPTLPPAGSSPFSDAFPAASVSQLSRNWTDHVGNISVLSGSATSNDSLNVSTLNGVSEKDVVVSANVNLSVGQYAGLVARYSGLGDNNMYWAGLTRNSDGTGTAIIYRNLGGTWTLLATRNVGTLPLNPLTLKFEVINDSLKLFISNGSWINSISANDSTLTTGSVGLRSTQGVVWSAFTAGLHATLVNATLPLAFNDDFSTAYNTNQMNLNWRENLGSFIVDTTAKTLTTNSSLAVATVNIDPSQVNTVKDVVVTDSVNTLTTGQFAGLVARYSGPGDTNMYWGALTKNADGTGTAVIYRNIGGVWTLLSSNSVSPATLALAGPVQNLRFEVINDSLKFFVNGVWTVSANDSMLAFGSVGLRSTQGVVWKDTASVNMGDVHAPLSTPSIASAFTDAFTSTDAVITTQLSSNWRENFGNFAINIGAQTLTTNTSLAVATLNTAPASDVYVTASTTLSVGQYAGLVARYSGLGDTNMYWAGLTKNADGTGTAYIFRNLNGTWTQLNSATVNAGTMASQQNLRFEAIGSYLTLFVNSSAAVTTNDSTPQLAQGLVGLRSTQGVVWKGSASSPTSFTASVTTSPVTVTTAPASFSDNFSSAPNYVTNWRQNLGSFSGAGTGSLTGVSSLNIATLYGVSATDVVVSDSVTLTNGQYGGLVARYSGPADMNMYWAGIGNVNGTYTAYLFRNVGGAWTQLATKVLSPAPSSPIAMRFEVIGDSLKFFINNNLAVAANDSLLTKGSVGVRSTQGAVFTGTPNFTVNLRQPLTSAASLPNLPSSFSDDFATSNYDGTTNAATAGGSELGLAWKENLGAFTISGGNLTSVNALNIATLNGVSEANAVVSDTVTLASGQFGGLVARYGLTGGDTNMYWAALGNSAGSYTAYIFRNVGGTWTLLTSKSLSTLSGPQALRFEVINDSLKFFVNGTLALATNDAALATGSVGLRSTQGAVWTGTPSFSAKKHDPLTATAIPTSDLTTQFADDFSAASSANQLNYNAWLEKLGAFSVNTTAKTVTTETSLAVATLNGVSQADVVVTDTLTLASGQYGGLVARYSGPGDTNMYWAALGNVGNSYTAYLFRNVSGTWTMLTSKALGVLSGPQALRFEVINDSLKLFVNGVFAVSANDSALATGSVGIRSTQGAIWNNGTSVSFTADKHQPLSTTAIPLSPAFTDDFSSPYSLNQLSLNWRENLGSFTIGAGNLTSNTALNVATVQVVTQPDVVVSASATVPSGQFAGLVARYAGSGDKNMYWAAIANSGGAYTAFIYRNVNGTWTLLAQQAIGNLGSGAQALRFEVVGTSLKLFVNNVWRLSATDSLLPTGGSVGLRSTQGVVWMGTPGFVAGLRAAPTTPTLSPTFTDGFSTLNYDYATNTETATGGALGLAWTENVGAYSVVAGEAIGVGSLNLATINATQTDAVLTANITLTSGQYFGLVARYSGTGDNNMYWAAISNINGNYTAYIYKNVSGTWTLLASLGISSFFGQMQFDVIGSTLTLKLDGSPYLQVTDTSLTSGRSGIRSTAGARVTTFSAT